MKKNTTKWLILLGIVALATILLVYKIRSSIYEGYLQLFHQSAIIANYNKKGQLDGEYIAYVNGRVYARANFKNGVREGWFILYDEETGKKRDEIFYIRGEAEGIENAFYKNGNLNYTVHWRNGKYSKSQYHYSDNGILTNYNTFDQNKKDFNGYCYVMYDKTGKFHQILGNMFSSIIYSTCEDSIITLTDNGKYKCINSLYIDVATPPQLTPMMTIFINDVKFDKTRV